MRLTTVAWLAALAAWPPCSAAQPDLVVIVRHAEKASSPAGDPPLSAAGEARAAALADALEHSGISAIITTSYQRTRSTAQVLAERTGIQPQVIEARRGSTEAHVEAVAAAVKALAGRVLVVGHSNTVARIVEALDGPALPDLCETSHAHAFVLAPGPGGPALQHWRYGATDPAPTEGCQ